MLVLIAFRFVYSPTGVERKLSILGVNLRARKEKMGPKLREVPQLAGDKSGSPGSRQKMHLREKVCASIRCSQNRREHRGNKSIKKKRKERTAT